MPTNLTLLQSIYAAISIVLTIWLAHVLSTNGQLFLDDVFDRKDLAKAVNKLLVVGFYLVNIGYACTQMPGWMDPSQSIVGVLAQTLGTLLLTLAAMHFGNLLLFHIIRKRARGGAAIQPPVIAQAYTAAMPMPVVAPTNGAAHV